MLTVSDLSRCLGSDSVSDLQESSSDRIKVGGTGAGPRTLDSLPEGSDGGNSGDSPSHLGIDT